MTTSFDDLVEQLLYDVALSGSRGIGTAELEEAIRAFHRSRGAESHPVSDDEASLLFSDVAPDRSITVDDALVNSVWDWLVKHADLELRHVDRDEAVPPPAIANQASLDATNPKPPSTSTRLFASNEKVWQAITGHGPDSKRVAAMEFDLLSIIAVHGPEGILQPDLVRLSQQDKRSVPKRTDSLARKGYISKDKVIATKTQTAILKLWKYGNRPQAGPQHVRAYSDGTNPDESDIVYYDQWFKGTIKVLQENGGIVALADLRTALNIAPSALGRRAFSRCVERLTTAGVLRKLKAKAERGSSRLPRESWVRCVQLLRVPTDDDRVAFRGLAGHKDGVDGAQNQPSDGEDSALDIANQASVAADDEDDEDGPLMDTRNPPQWSPDLPMNNILFNLIDSAGTDGISSMELVPRTTGPFWRRPLEEIMSNLTDLWQTSQPPHLRHLTILRDTGLLGKSVHYKYFSIGNFEKAVKAGTADWDAVNAQQKAPAKKKGRPKSDELKSDVDEWGFPKLDSRLFADKDGQATLLDGQVAAKRELGLTNKARSFQSASGDLNRLLSIPQGHNHRVKLRAVAPASRPRKPKKNALAKDDKASRMKGKTRAEELAAGEATPVVSGVMTEAEQSDSNVQDHLMEQSDRSPAVDTMPSQGVALETRASRMGTGSLPRSRPGVYLEPPDARELRFSEHYKRGRRPKTLVVVIKSDELRHYEWFAHQKSSDVFPYATLRSMRDSIMDDAEASSSSDSVNDVAIQRQQDTPGAAIDDNNPTTPTANVSLAEKSTQSNATPEVSRWLPTAGRASASQLNIGLQPQPESPSDGLQIASNAIVPRGVTSANINSPPLHKQALQPALLSTPIGKYGKEGLSVRLPMPRKKRLSSHHANARHHGGKFAAVDLALQNRAVESHGVGLLPTTASEALIQSQTGHIQAGPPTGGPSGDDDVKATYPGLYEKDFTLQHPEIKWQHRGHGRYAAASVAPNFMAGPSGRATNDVAELTNNKPHNASVVLDARTPPDAGEISSSVQRQQESLQDAQQMDLEQSVVPPTPVNTITSSLRNGTVMQPDGEGQGQSTGVGDLTTMLDEPKLSAHEGPADNEIHLDDSCEIGSLPELVPVGFEKSATTIDRNSKKSAINRRAGSVRAERVHIVLATVKAAGGVFPGATAMWYPFRSIWEKKYNQKADRVTVDRLVEDIVRNRQLSKYKFSFRDSKGRLRHHDILTLPFIAPGSLQARAVQKAVIDYYPEVFLPKDADVQRSLMESGIRTHPVTVESGDDEDDSSDVDEAGDRPSAPILNVNNGYANYPVDKSVLVRRTFQAPTNLASPSTDQQDLNISVHKSLAIASSKFDKAAIRAQAMQKLLTAPCQIFHTSSGTIGTIGIVGCKPDRAVDVQGLWKRYQPAPTGLTDILDRTKASSYVPEATADTPHGRFLDEVERVEQWENQIASQNSIIGPFGGWIFVNLTSNQPPIGNDHNQPRIEEGDFYEYNPSLGRQPKRMKTSKPLVVESPTLATATESTPRLLAALVEPHKRALAPKGMTNSASTDDTNTSEISSSPSMATSRSNSPFAISDPDGTEAVAEELSAETNESVSTAFPTSNLTRSGNNSLKPQNLGDDICAACIRNKRNCFGGSETERCTFCKPTNSLCTRVEADRAYLETRAERGAARAQKKALRAERLRQKAERKEKREQTAQQRKEQLASRAAHKNEKERQKAEEAQKVREQLVAQGLPWAEEEIPDAEQTRTIREPLTDEATPNIAETAKQSGRQQSMSDVPHGPGSSVDQSLKCNHCIKARRTCHGGSSTNKCAYCKTTRLLCSKVHADRQKLLSWNRVDPGLNQDNPVSGLGQSDRPDGTSIERPLRRILPQPNLAPTAAIDSANGQQSSSSQVAKRKLPRAFEVSGDQVRKSPRTSAMSMFDSSVDPMLFDDSDAHYEPEQTTAEAQATADWVVQDDSDEEYEPTRSQRSIARIKRTKGPPFADVQRLNIAVTLVDLLCAGAKDECAPDWNIVAHALAFKYSPAVLEERWKVQGRSSRAHLSKLKSALHEPFLTGYASGEIPSIDFANLQRTDWPALVRWVETNILPLPEDDPLQQLPGSREILERDFEIAVQPLGTERSVAHTESRVMIAKSWARAIILTPNNDYDVQRATGKMVTLGSKTLDTAVAELEASHTVVRKKAGRQLPGRNFLISKAALSRFRRWPGGTAEPNYLREVAAARSRWIDYFQQHERIVRSPDLSDPDVLILTEMVGQGHLELCSVIPESTFESVVVNGTIGAPEILPVIWAKTPRFSAKHNLNVNVLIPSEPSGKLRGAIPMWVDINGDLIDEVWDMVLRSILHIVVYKPYSTATTIEQAHDGHLWKWEIELVLKWMQQIGLAYSCDSEAMKGTDNEAWRASEWWYCAFMSEIARWKAPTGVLDEAEL